MNDTREDQLLCPECYVPVECYLVGGLIQTNTYSCPNCPENWTYPNLIRASELERRIEEGIKQEVNKT